MVAEQAEPPKRHHRVTVLSQKEVAVFLQFPRLQRRVDRVPERERVPFPEKVFSRQAGHVEGVYRAQVVYRQPREVVVPQFRRVADARRPVE